MLKMRLTWPSKLLIVYIGFFITGPLCIIGLSLFCAIFNITNNRSIFIILWVCSSVGPIVGSIWLFCKTYYVSRLLEMHRLLCPYCLYCLRGLGNRGYCPECGHNWKRRNVLKQWKVIRYFWRN